MGTAGGRPQPAGEQRTASSLALGPILTQPHLPQLAFIKHRFKNMPIRYSIQSINLIFRKIALFILACSLLAGCKTHDDNINFINKTYDEKNQSIYHFENAFLLSVYLNDGSSKDYLNPDLHSDLQGWIDENNIPRCRDISGAFGRLENRLDSSKWSYFQCGQIRLSLKNAEIKETPTGYKIVTFSDFKYETIDLE